ncbi:hypothetical protein [Nocardioides sp. AE5]|uniref:hypothetical protein n=1 Tax=Nocardioides sp. AE5 TaxID=2962573 RepID=UPI002882497C|nr:hypothetical protein [Nocardioides sp. AE5]MDT0201556.1 hypothetical protein [Nocardioides sp. AE5]
MSRRVSLPAADDLFRPTSDTTDAEPAAPKLAAAPDPTDATSERASGPSRRKASGRVRHDEKMTVYITSEELLELEHARLSMRRSTGKAVDRGRLVRAAIAMALADFEENGDASEVVARLRET